MKNKKKNLTVISLIMLFMVVISAVILLRSGKSVERFSVAKIVDCYGTEITNYQENKMPFTIEKSNEQEEIKVNGKQYQTGERIYQVGEYEIEISDGYKKEKSKVKIEPIEKSETSEYSIYIATETLPTLLASIDMADNQQGKGFLWTARTSTVHIDKARDNFPNLQTSAYSGKITEEEFRKQVLPEVKSYIQQVLQEDENAYFHLYTEEDRFYLELELFGKIGLDDNRYELNMYTDGTLGYVREYEITKANKYERFIEEKNAYFEIVDLIKSNTGDFNDHPGSYLVDKKSTLFNVDYNFDYMLISTLRDNIKILLQYPEMIKYQDEKISKEMEQANIEKIVIQEKFDQLDENSQKIFLDNIDLNKEELDKNYFSDNDKKYLVITGTVPIYEKIGEAKFKEIITKVSQDYGKEYTLLYKPHPRAIPTEEQEEFFTSLNIKVLPGAIPMEAISFVYPNLQLGGFGSSLYLSVDKGKTLFFFAKNKQELVDPLDELYDSLFSEAKFYN